MVGLQNVREDVLMAIRCSGLMVRQVGREDALWLGWGSRICDRYFSEGSVVAPMERAAEQRLCMIGHAVHCELKQIAWHGFRI